MSTSTPKTTSELLNATMFRPESGVKQLWSTSFAVDTRERVCLRVPDCTVILFYLENDESRELCRIWANVASQSVRANLGAVNLTFAEDVLAAFRKLETDTDNPLYWARLQGLPFIMVYRSCYPVAFYNGHRAVEPLISYITTLACERTYFEPTLALKSITPNAAINAEMSGGKSNEPSRTTSNQFVVSNPMRGYDPRKGFKLIDPSEYKAPVKSTTTPVNLTR